MAGSCEAVRNAATTKKGKPHTKVQTGCLTCKARRIKCDEHKPSCTRCTTTGRRCDGYAPSRSRHSPPPAAILVVSTPIIYDFNSSGRAECDRRALAAFQFFYEVSAPALLNFGSRSFWNVLVLQASHAEESIKHLVIAASALDAGQCPNSTTTTARGEQVNWIFLAHHTTALRLLSSKPEPDVGVMLIACLLLCLCEEFQHNSYAALQHIRAGRNILRAYGQKRRSGWGHASLVLDEIAPIFSKLGMHAGHFDREVLPANLNLPAWKLGHEHSANQAGWCGQADSPTVDRLPVPRPETERFGTGTASCAFPPVSLTSRPLFLENLANARSTLAALAPCCLSGQPQTPVPPRSRFHIVPSITEHMNQWLEDFNALTSDLEPTVVSASFGEIHVLRTYHQCLGVTSRTVSFGDEILFDDQYATLEHVIKKASMLVPSFAEALLSPLFLVASRCRDASLRRQAIELLEQCGLEGETMAIIAKKVVKIEERGLSDLVVCADVPERQRIRVVGVGVGPCPGSMMLQFVRPPYNDFNSISEERIRNPAETRRLMPTLLQYVLNFEWL